MRMLEALAGSTSANGGAVYPRSDPFHSCGCDMIVPGTEASCFETF